MKHLETTGTWKENPSSIISRYRLIPFRFSYSSFQIIYSTHLCTVETLLYINFAPAFFTLHHPISVSPLKSLYRLPLSGVHHLPDKRVEIHTSHILLMLRIWDFPNLKATISSFKWLFVHHAHISFMGTHILCTEVTHFHFGSKGLGYFQVIVMQSHCQNPHSCLRKNITHILRTLEWTNNEP